MLDEEAVRDWGWWKTPHWDRYCDATETPHGRPVHTTSYVIDLSEPLHPSKGHRAAIARERAVDKIHRSFDLDHYHEIHAITAGRETRSQASWELMRKWLDEGYGALFTNTVSAWAYVMMYEHGAYYASAVGRDSHHLQFAIMHQLANSGYAWYELGNGATDGISIFKRGFGCEVVEP